MITVIGCGTGSPPARIGDADLVVGAARHLAAAELPERAERVTLGPLGPALDRIAAYVDGNGDAVPEAHESRPAAPQRETGAEPCEGPGAESRGGPEAEPRGRSGAESREGHEGKPDEGPEAEPGGGSGAESREGFGGGAPGGWGGAGGGPRVRGRVVVLASGDPGFFGVVRVLAARFGPDRLDVRPAAPALAVAFARAGLPWDDAAVVSAHGRDLRTAVNVCRAHPKTAVLTGPGAGPAELGAALAASGLPRILLVATALGSADEDVVRLSPADAAGRRWPPDAVNVVLCLDVRPGRSVAPAQRTLAGPGPYPLTRRPGDGWALPEEDFDHRAGMVTKYEVRALALARLGPRLGDLVWDVGAGSGSVAVECARFGAAVVAVERDAAGVARIRANAAAHGVDVQAVHGTAPTALAGLPGPDAVFVGGGGADVAEVVAACARRARRAVVVTLAAVERVPAVRAALAAAGFGVDGVLLQSSRLAPLPGEVTRLAATNPVFVLWGLRESGTAPSAGAERQQQTARLPGPTTAAHPASRTPQLPLGEDTVTAPPRRTAP
ncbi:precorrin-6y C5,15-methyltransferase (decarboxylating) subunit CbiE [Streptomyces sp. 184]|uniref:precorrin-6y C5,15-methyltransferase (decarboxylating) subunit CbiE n=1 Tax=Streptomyces sp. 184 TaxID=1827526 RepID=UPI0038926BE4